MNNTSYIEKSTGEQQRFSRAKLKRSLRRAGASADLSERVTVDVERRTTPGMSTEQIQGHALTCLLQENSTVACRYHLKTAIAQLGPTGYSFEDFIGAVLAEYGYDTKVGQIVQGKCVSHEIDVIAEKDGERAAVECKFHQQRSFRTDVRVTLYMKARYLDLEEAMPPFTQVWIVTNTQFTSEAIKYGMCAGIRLIGWRYPANGSLEQMVESKGLYPITIFPWLKPKMVQGLIAANMVLASDLLDARAEVVARAGQMNMKQAERLRNEAVMLFS